MCIPLRYLRPISRSNSATVVMPTSQFDSCLVLGTYNELVALMESLVQRQIKDNSDEDVLPTFLSAYIIALKGQ